MTPDNPGQAVAPPTRDLSSIFDPAKRPKLGPRPTRHTTPAPTSAEQSPPPDETAAGEEPAKTPTKPKATKKKPARPAAPAPERPAARKATPAKPASAAADATLKKGITLYLTDALTQQLAMARATTHRTRTQLLLDAIKSTHERLGDLVEEDRRPQVVNTGLWDEVVSPDTAPQPPKRQVFVEPTVQQLHVIDELKETAGARDRSHLCAIALAAYLPTLES